MSQVIGLFESQKEAEAAINALTAANLDEKDIQTVESWDDGAPTNKIASPMPAADSSTGNTGVPLPGALSLPGLKLSDEEARYFKRSVQAGGVLVAVELSGDEALSRAKRILEEQGGKVAVE